MTKAQLQERNKTAPTPPARPLPIVNSKFATFGEQLLAIRNAGRGPEFRVDPRLLEIRAASGANEKVPSEGGFLVQPEFVPQLIERMYQTGEILSRCTEMPITNSNGIKFPKFNETSRANGSRLGGIQVYWASEAATATKSKPQLTLSELLTNKLIGLIYVTDELAQDAAALEQFTTAAFGQEMSFVLENTVIGGTGVGQPQGILKSPALITVAAEAGQSAGSILFENIQKMWGRCFAPSRKTSVWLINQDADPQLLSMRVHNAASTDYVGGPVYIAEGTAETAPYPALFGRPVIPVEHCSTVGTLGDVILADFSRYVIAKREDRADVSIHVQFLQDEDVFRFVMRVDGQTIDAAPLTPLNGSNTTSPFIALASRP